MLTLTGYRTVCAEIKESPLPHEELEIRFSLGKNGWVNIQSKKDNWGYHPAESRWSFGRAVSADAEIVEKVLAALGEWLATAPKPVAAPASRQATRPASRYRGSDLDNESNCEQFAPYWKR